jgi:hypothetical protein
MEKKMSTNIYEQAIAEAKKLREVAEQNAKNAIIEAITPRVRELIDRELTDSGDYESDFLNEDYDSDLDIVLEESAILELAKEISGKEEVKEKEEKKEKEVEEEIDESSIISMIDSLIKEEEEKESEESDKKDDEEASSKSQKESYKNEDDMNLEELLNEIKMEIDLGEIEDEEIESALLELMPTVKMIEDEEEEGDVEMEEAPEDDEEGGEEEMKFDFSELEGGESDDAPAEEEAVEEVFSINETALSRELQRLRNNRSSNGKNGTQNLNESRYREQLLKEQRNNRELKGKLDEYRGAVEDLRDQLNEMNLFNAKLLYVNKLLQTKGLDSSQKKTIIESIDNAESLREVKLVYKTLSESVNKKTAGSLNESKIRRRASSSSRPTKSGGTLLNESSNQVDRWARLAGLK